MSACPFALRAQFEEKWQHGTLFLTLHNLFILFHFLNGTGCRTVIMMENAWGT